MNDTSPEFDPWRTPDYVGELAHWTSPRWEGVSKYTLSHIARYALDTRNEALAALIEYHHRLGQDARDAALEAEEIRRKADREERERLLAEALTVPCPTCQEPAGEGCTTLTKARTPKTDSHMDRLRLARSILYDKPADEAPEGAQP